MAYKAFVSSTFEDLKEHRQAVIASLLKAGLTVDPMEEWTASTGEPKTFSQDRIKDCHLFILLVAYRRGHVPRGEERSITQLEYEAARSSGIDVLVFMLKEKALWLREFDDRDKDPGIGEFRRELGEQHGVGFFGHEPGSIEIAPAITRWVNEKSSASPAAAALQWPQQVVESLSSQLNDDFDVHMRAGEALSADKARARYVQGLIKLRDRQEHKLQTAKGSKIPTEGPLEDFIASDAMRLLVIGGGGSGKTTILKHLAAKGSRQAAQDARAPIVVYLRLTSFDRPDGGLDLLFDRLSLAAQLTRPGLEALWRTGRRPIVFLLDGVNEVAQAYQSSCVQALRTLLQFSPPLHRYVITSRPGSELEVLSRQVSEDQHFRLADIVQFGPERVREYLQAQGRSELQSRLSGRLEELASNPFLLWAITRTFVSHEHASLKNRGSLFSALIDRYIFDEREQSKPKPRPTQYNYALIKKPVLAKLALRMSDAGVTVASEAALLEPIAESLAAADRERDQKRELPLEAETFMPKDYTAKLFVRETVDNGVLVRDGDRLRFMHESVQEYFAAVALCASSVEDLAKRAPSLGLARLDARGPLFETLVTWSGLSTPKQVTALVEALREKHPLLAAQLAVEAGLSGETLERLRRAFLSLTRSEHEQRQQLGAQGLMIVPSEEPEVLDRLIELLDDSHLMSLAEDALKSIPTTSTLSALVNAWTSGSKEVDSRVAGLLRDLVRDHSGLIVEALLDVWRAGQVPRDRVVQLAAFLDTKHRWDKDGRPYIRERLATLAVEAELGGDLQRSADLDALRQQAAQPVVAQSGIEGAATPTISLGGRFRALLKRREELTKAYGERDNVILEQIVREGTLFERGVARDILVERRSPAAVALVVEAALDEGGARWLNALESFPRESVRRLLGAQIEVLNGDRLARAQLLADLLADTPPRELLQKVFRDSGAGLRACAARASERLGTEGVDLLIEHLGTETSEDVLEAGLQVLGRSGVPAAIDFLLELLLDPVVWWHWPVSNSESWPVLIHHALVDAAAADRTMARLERVLASTPAGSLDQARHAVWEASRWLPATRAVELLRIATTHQDRAVREAAQVWLARAGDADAWRRVLRNAMEARSEPFSLPKIVTSGLAAEAVPSEIWNSMKADSQSVLQPALADADPDRRAAALDLTRQLPEAWVTSAWQEDALSTAENLLQSVETEHRLSAVRAIFHWTPDAADRIFEILMNDPDEAVSRRAYELLGDESGRRIETRLDSALRVGDAAVASSLVERVGPLLTYKDLNRVRDTSARWLDAGDRDQCIAALLALTFHPAPEDDDEWKEIGNRARAAFERLEIDETWQRFAAHIRPLSEHRRQFVYILLEAFGQRPEQFTAVLKAVGELWQDDIPTLTYAILIDIERDPDQAASRLAAMERRFPDQKSHTWLANQFARLDRPADALRQYRLAAAEKPANDEIHFRVGWFAFVTGDFDSSIDATRRSLTLQPANAMAQFNLGVALLARRETVGAEAAYKRGAALARRMSPAAARQQIEGALGDFALLPERPETVTVAVDRIRASLERERERLAASAEDA